MYVYFSLIITYLFDEENVNLRKAHAFTQKIR